MTKEERTEYFKNFKQDERDKLIAEGSAILSLGFDVVEEGDDYKAFEQTVRLCDEENPSIKYDVKCRIYFWEDSNSEYVVTVSYKKKTPNKEYEEKDFTFQKSFDIASDAVEMCMISLAEIMRVHGLVQETGKGLVDFKCLVELQMEYEITKKINSCFDDRYSWIVPENNYARDIWEQNRHEFK